MTRATSTPPSARSPSPAAQGRKPIHIRPYRPGDERAFEPRLDFAREIRALAWDFAAAGPPGPTWTLVRWPAEVIGVGGAIRQREGHYQGWAWLAAVPRGDWPLLIGCARAALGQLERRHGARVITALCRTGFGAAQRVLERLGFTRSAEVTDWPGYRVLARRSQAGEAR